MIQNFFRAQKNNPLEKSIQLIEDLLRQWDLNPSQIKDPDKNIWYLTQGSATFHILLFQFSKGPESGTVDAIEIGSSIMKLPQENFLPLYRKLLELNASSVGTYFALRPPSVMLLSTREIEGLDNSELRTMVDDVRLYADYWDDILIKEFGGSK